MTLNDIEPQNRVKIFLQFLAAAHISTVNCNKIDQDNLHVKFLALNIDFSIPSPDLLCLRRPAHVGVKEGPP